MVVMEYKTPRGATIRWHDDAYVDKTEAELKAREENLNTMASVLFYRNLLKHKGEKQVRYEESTT